MYFELHIDVVCTLYYIILYNTISERKYYVRSMYSIFFHRYVYIGLNIWNEMVFDKRKEFNDGECLLDGMTKI